jgi:hypothetical protein
MRSFEWLHHRIVGAQNWKLWFPLSLAQIVYDSRAELYGSQLTSDDKLRRLLHVSRAFYCAFQENNCGRSTKALDN